MKDAARRSPRTRKGLLPSGEKLHTRLSLIELKAQGRKRKAFIFMPRSKEAKSVEFPEGERPQKRPGLVFPPAPRH
jgi:hypothetical protein